MFTRFTGGNAHLLKCYQTCFWWVFWCLTGDSCRAKGPAGGASFFTLWGGPPTSCSSCFLHCLCLCSSNVLPKNMGEKVTSLGWIFMYPTHLFLTLGLNLHSLCLTSQFNRQLGPGFSEKDINKWMALGFSFRQTSLKLLQFTLDGMGTTNCFVITQKYVFIHLPLSQVLWQEGHPLKSSLLAWNIFS